MKRFDALLGTFNEFRVPWHNWESFKMDSGATFLCSPTFLRILLDSSQEICHQHFSHGSVNTITTSRVSDMFNTHMQSLLDISVANDLLHGNSHGALCDVEYDTGLSVVVFVWQSLLLSRVADNINNVSDFVCFKLAC
jgi:hypothetical protein